MSGSIDIGFGGSGGGASAGGSSTVSNLTIGAPGGIYSGASQYTDIVSDASGNQSIGDIRALTKQLGPTQLTSQVVALTSAGGSFTAAQTAAPLLVLTMDGSVTAGLNIGIPNVPWRSWWVYNSGAYACAVYASGGSNPTTVQPGKLAFMFVDNAGNMRGIYSA